MTTQGTLNPDPGDQAGVPFRLDDYEDIGSLAFGNGTGYKYVIGTRGVDGLFKPLFRFHDNGRLEFAEGGGSILAGAGTPEGHIAAGPGSIYLRTDAAAVGSTLYIKQSGDGLTGWLSSSEAVLADVGTPGSYVAPLENSPASKRLASVRETTIAQIPGLLTPQRKPSIPRMRSLLRRIMLTMGVKRGNKNGRHAMNKSTREKPFQTLK